ncbi:MAG: lyase family protein, partial [Balneolales bacterium]
AWAAGYLDLLLADIESLQQAYEVNDCCPLGSAAGYGVPYFEVDREYLTHLLGFGKMQKNVTSSQLSRGTYELRLIDALGYGAGTFNRMASDVVWYANPLLNLVELSDDQVSGSSIMPQKRNPDAWELIRGSHHEFSGWSVQMSSLSTNLSSGYHRDLQLAKKFVLQSTFAANRLGVAVKHALSGLKFNIESARQSLTPDLMATHKANEYVRQGMTFREAYRKVAAELDSINVDAYDDLSATYNHSGAPGHYNGNHYLEQIKNSQNWLDHEIDKWGGIKENLFHFNPKN